MLSSDEGIEVVGEESDGRGAVYRTRVARPDVILMDVRMPELDGIAATREVLADFPEAKIVILTTFEQDDYIFGALSAGASGLPAQADPARGADRRDPHDRGGQLAALAVGHEPGDRAHGEEPGAERARRRRGSRS